MKAAKTVNASACVCRAVQGAVVFFLRAARKGADLGRMAMSASATTVPMLFKFVHKQVSFETGLRAVLRVAISSKDCHAEVLLQTPSKVVIRKDKKLRDPAMLKLFKIPPRVQFTETWVLETSHTPPRMLMTTSINLNLYQMQIGTMYECVTADDGHTDLFVQSKIAVTGLADNVIMLTFVKAASETEFQQERLRERKMISEERRQLQQLEQQEHRKPHKTR